MVVNRTCGINPPKISPALRCSAARGPSWASQYGHTLSLVGLYRDYLAGLETAIGVAP